MRQWLRDNKYRVHAWVIGSGLILFAVHNPNQPALDWAFLPIVGLAFSLFALLFVLMDKKAEITLGPRWVWIPLLVIIASIAASSIAEVVSGAVTFTEGLAPIAFSAYMFGIYLVARILKEDLFAPFAVAVVIEAISIVADGLTTPGLRNGGIVGPTNYDMASGFLILGVLFSAVKRQWWLLTVAMVGLAFAGAEEAMVAGVILGVVWLIRRDFGKRLVVIGGCVVVGAVLMLTTGLGGKLYATAETRVSELVTMVQGGEPDHSLTNSTGEDVTYPRRFIHSQDKGDWPVQYTYEWEETLDNILWWRWSQYTEAARNFSWVGNGYMVTEFNFSTVHNVPGVIVQQVGPIAGAAWLFLMIACLVKTRWKYAFTAVLALSLFDHFIWTQVAPWWWALVGVATVTLDRSDLIFRREKVE